MEEKHPIYTSRAQKPLKSSIIDLFRCASDPPTLRTPNYPPSPKTLLIPLRAASSCPHNPRTFSMPKPPPSSSSIPSLPTSSPPSHSLDYKASCPQLPLYCPHCSTSTTVRGRFKAYKLGRGLRTHIGLKHDMKHDSACSRYD